MILVSFFALVALVCDDNPNVQFTREDFGKILLYKLTVLITIYLDTL